MWRIYRRIHRRLTITCSEGGTTQQIRLQSTGGGGGSKGKVFLALTGASVATAGGVALYAQFDPSFKKQLFANIPEPVLAKLGWSESKKAPETLPPKKVTILPKPVEKVGKDKPEPPAKIEKPTPALVTEKGSSSTQKSPETTATSTKPITYESLPASLISSMSHEALQKRLTAQELDEAAENAALEQIIQESIQNVKDFSRDAVAAHDEAQKGIKFYLELLERSLDDKEKKGAIGVQLNSAALKKNETLKTADQLTVRAKEHLEKLRSAVNSGRESKLTRDNAVLMQADAALNDLTYKVQSAEALTASGRGDGRIMADYCDLVEKSRQDYKKGMEKIVPELKFTEKVQHLNKEELNQLLKHAQHHVEQLQKQVAKQQASENQRFQHALEGQQREHEKNFQKRIGMEIDKQHRDLQLAFHKQMSQLQEEYEQELRIQLRRQTAAHSDHLQESLQSQQTELFNHYQQELQVKIEQARQEFEAGLSKSYARLRGIEEGMKARVELNSEAKMSQALWLVCQTLKQATLGSHEQKLQPLGSSLDALKKTVENKKPLVLAIVNSIPKLARERGIYSEMALKERFLKVHHICRRTALVDDRGGSLIRYGLSYVQSLLLVDAAVEGKTRQVLNEAVDPSSLTNVDVLCRAKLCVDRNDLEQAVRYMNLLVGAPRLVAGDWINEVRVTLETRQAAQALMAFSSILGIHGYI